MNAVIYARYSSDLQREESAEAQIRYCNEYAEKNGYNIIRIYADKAKSAKGDKVSQRYEFQKMIKDSKHGLFDTVLVHKYNRFARSMKDHVNYEDKLNSNGVNLIAVAEDFGQGKEAIIMKALMRSLSEYYLADMADEVRKGHRENAEKALHNGGYAPFGYDIVDQHFVVNEFEAGFVKKMFQCALKGIGFKDLIVEMERAGIRGKRGKPIRYPSIYEILRNERYTGTYVYAVKTDKKDRRAKKNAVRIDNAMPALISRGEWEEVQEIMDKRKQSGRNSDYLCRSLVYCGNCGAKMNGHISNSKGKEYRTFICSKSCGVGTISMDYVDNFARSYLRDLLSDECQKDVSDSIRNYRKGEAERVERHNEAVRREISAKQKQYDGLMETLATGGLPAEIIAEVGSKMKAIKEEIEGLRERRPPKDFTEESIKGWLNSIKQAPSPENIHLLVEKITVFKINGKTDASAISTLTSVVRNIGGDTPLHCFPTILFEYHA
jgi:site-specific DNA recombinase